MDFHSDPIVPDINARIICIDDPIFGPPIHSTYSPWLMHGAGWDRYRMYFGRNEIQKGISADRIYLSENRGDGKTGWEIPMTLLVPGGVGQSALIHDPTVTIVNGVWQMFYTGTDGPDANQHYNNRIFHATSNDGVTWKKEGQTKISGLPTQNGSYGCGEPSILFEDGTCYLYFFFIYIFSQILILRMELFVLLQEQMELILPIMVLFSGMIVTSPVVRKKGND